MIERLSGFAFLGGTSVLCLLVGLAVWAITKVRERHSYFHARREDLGRLGNELVDRLRHGDVGGADRVLGRSTAAEAALLRPALDWIDGGPLVVDAFMAAQRVGNRRDLERTLLPIEAVGRYAPWIGLFGSLVVVSGTLRQVAYAASHEVGTLLYGLSFALLPAAIGVAVGAGILVLHRLLAEEVAQIDTNLSVLSARVVTVLGFKAKLAQDFGLANNGAADGVARSSLPSDAGPDSRRPRSLTELD